MASESIAQGADIDSVPIGARGIIILISQVYIVHVPINVNINTAKSALLRSFVAT